MKNVKCLKCDWRGSSVDTLKQWFPVDAKTQELLMICPECKEGVCVGVKRKIETNETPEENERNFKERIAKGDNVKPKPDEGLREEIRETLEGKTNSLTTFGVECLLTEILAKAEAHYQAEIEDARKSDKEMFRRIVGYFRHIKVHIRPLTFEEKDMFEYFEQALKTGGKDV